jgi:hypothetical protein
MTNAGAPRVSKRRIARNSIQTQDPDPLARWSFYYSLMKNPPKISAREAGVEAVKMTNSEQEYKVSSQTPIPFPSLKNSNEVMIIPVNDVIVKYNLYPRQTHDETLIERYADNISDLPPIVVNQHHVLVDGYHRLAAFKIAGCTEIPVTVIYTENDNDILLQAVMLNSYHGLQLSADEKRHLARILSPSTDKGILAKSLGVSFRTIERWTSDERLVIEEERNKSIINLYIQFPITQQEIAFKLGIDQSTVSRGIKTMQERHLSELHTWFSPFNSTIRRSGLSNIEPLPQVLVENLLYFHTQPLNLVFDPFASSTNTMKACIRMQRRYYCCDDTGYDPEIKQWDISYGLPLDLTIPDLAYIDLTGREPFELFPSSGLAKQIKSILEELIKRKIPRIALHVYPCYLNSGNWEDPIMNLSWLTDIDYSIDRRYVMEYQHHGTEELKDQIVHSDIDKVCRIDHSDLIVWINRKFLQ